MNEIQNLNPQCIWRNFYALTQVPRPSGHLEKVQQFLLDFGQKAGVEAFKDPAGNIVMRKPASAGMESRKGIILQAHMDMVPQKTPESQHNFETDPIEPWIDGEWVRARGTTLGADNGLGVAAIMAIMEDKTLRHGPIDALITRDEETGMYGANELPEGELEGDILLNLDSEHWGKFVIGSAGGIDVTATLEYQEVDTDPDDAAVRLTVSGLRGGHSGLEINEGRGNANKLLVQVVRQAIEETEARLASWHGGNMRNAIPFKAEAVLTLPNANVEALREIAADWKETFNDEFKLIEPQGIEVSVELVDAPQK
ncbi:MAG: beta-Ala-His dipeptidase, partial [Prevotella sp.]|nr:beta-Ala-His dipeptidase [Prevotella sp.]